MVHSLAIIIVWIVKWIIIVFKRFVARLQNTLHNNRQYKKWELQTWIRSQQQGRIQNYIILFTQIPIQLLI